MPEKVDYSKAETSEEKKLRMDPDNVLDKISSWQAASKQDLLQYQERWATNLKLMRGIYNEDEKARSQVRGRSKLFFRKIWSTVWRLLASMHNAFLRDPDQVKIEGRMGNDNDVHKAGVLQVMVEYHRDRLYRKQDLFLQQVWGFHNILTHGLGVGLFSWEYDKANKIDGPRFKVYPPEQVFPDMTASLEHEMRFIIFESFHPLSELKARGYENLDQLETSTPENTTLRSVRHAGTTDPLQNPGENEYPRPGRYKGEEGDTPEAVGNIKVWQTFYRENGKIYYCVTAGTQAVLKKPEVSKYGDTYPSVLGVCLTEPHKLLGEGWPEPLEGPQVSLNDNINRRKDNVAQALNKHTIVSRFGNVDLASLINSRAGAVTLADDVNAVKEREIGDVTQSSYVEASADEGMMQEMSSVTAAKLGMEKAAKATTAHINLTESNAKIDLFIALIGETWVKRFHQKLAYLIQRFSTDQDLLRVANQTYRKRNKVDYFKMPQDVESVDDLDADIIVEVGLGTVSRSKSIEETMLAMDRAVMANQSMISLLQTGAVPLQQVKLFDTAKFMGALLPKIGYKNVDDYYVEVAPPPPKEGPGAGGPGGPPDGGPLARLTGGLQPPTRGAPTSLPAFPPGGAPGGF